MRRWGLIGLGVLALSGCGAKEPAPVMMVPNTRLIYHDQAGHGIFTFCDRASRVYQTTSGNFWVVPNGCPSGEP